jgi:hypothetical protein
VAIVTGDSERAIREVDYEDWVADQHPGHENERLRALLCPGCGAVLACQFTYDMGGPTSMVRNFVGTITRLRGELVLRADLSPSPRGRPVYGQPRRRQLGKTGHPILRRDRLAGRPIGPLLADGSQLVRPAVRRARPISYDMHPEFPGVWFIADAQPPCEILCLCDRRLQLTHDQDEDPA